MQLQNRSLFEGVRIFPPGVELEQGKTRRVQGEEGFPQNRTGRTGRTGRTTSLAEPVFTVFADHFCEDVPASFNYAAARKKRLRLLSEERLSPRSTFA